MYEKIVKALRAGDAAAAVPEIRAELLIRPDSAELHNLLGLCLQRLGDPEGARREVEHAMLLAPENAAVQMSHAALQLGRLDMVNAEAHAKAAVELDPNHLPAYLALIHLALGRGDLATAADMLKRARRLDAQSAQMLMAEGRVADANGDRDRALKFYTAAAEADPGNATAFVMIGLTYLMRDMPAFAEQALKKAQELAPDDPGVLSALVSAQDKQGMVEEPLAHLDKLLSRFPDAIKMRSLRARLRGAAGQLEIALEDCLLLCDRTPTDPELLAATCLVLLRLERKQEAIDLIEKALLLAPEDERLWQLRLDLAGGRKAAIGILKRWTSRFPASARAIEKLAQALEAEGQLAEAEEQAGNAVSLDHGRAMAHFILVRAELNRDPASALRRLEDLWPAAVTPEGRRMVLAWRGLAQDRLGDHQAAAESFRAMAAHANAGHELPMPQPAGESVAEAVEGCVLWFPTGTPAAGVLSALRPALGERLLQDRIQSEVRGDGFGHGRAVAGHPEAGTAARWKAVLVEAGIDPATVVDWVPFWDGYMDSALPGIRLVVGLVDPRDAFLHWLVFGSEDNYAFLAETRHSADWQALVFEGLAKKAEENPTGLALVRLDGLAGNAPSLAEQFSAALTLAQPLDSTVLAQPVFHHGGSGPSQFPSGHWRFYRDAFAEEFARLTPVAIRLGYPAD